MPDNPPSDAEDPAEDVAPDPPVDPAIPPAEAPPTALEPTGTEAAEDGPTPTNPPATGEGNAPAQPAPAHTEQPATPVSPDPEGLPVEWMGAGALVLALAIAGAWVSRSLVQPPRLPTQPGPTAPLAGPQEPPESASEPASKQVSEEPPETLGIAGRLARALARTGSTFRGLFGRPVDEELLESLEEALLIADVGVRTSQRLMDRVRAEAASDSSAEVLRRALHAEMTAILHEVHTPLHVGKERPYVFLVVGVNGSGKTTTIGKLASRFAADGHKVLLGAADTYRAAAADQLGIWAERAGVDLVRHDEGADPGAVAYDTMQAAVARGADVVLIDTAGRLQTRKPLMEQLTKIRRVIGKVVEGGPHGTLLVIDGTMGQNALSQAQLFHEATPLTGVAVTKLDGTAKGGVVLAVADQMKLPIQLVGVGEQVDDLRDFDPAAFVDAVLSTDEAGTKAE